MESCCYWADYQIKSKRCKLKENSICSPSQGECCSSDCNFKDKLTICSHRECNEAISCTGKSSRCPFEIKKIPDYSKCYKNTGVCIQGVGKLKN